MRGSARAMTSRLESSNGVQSTSSSKETGRKKLRTGAGKGTAEESRSGNKRPTRTGPRGQVWGSAGGAWVGAVSGCSGRAARRHRVAADADSQCRREQKTQRPNTRGKGGINFRREGENQPHKPVMKRGPTSLRGGTQPRRPRVSCSKVESACAETQETAVGSSRLPMLHVDIQGRATTLAPQLMIRSSRGQKPRPDAGSGAPATAGQGAAGGFWKEGKQLKQGGVGVEGGRTRVHDATPPSDPCPGLPWSPHRHGLKRGSGSELCQSSVHSGPCRKTSRWLCLQPWMQPALPRRPRVSGYEKPSTVQR